ncbi:hypothetical protein [Pseudoxanthomonas indica]|uniref:Uncharacterized protein n=1 Tax=Pseudoxanthomonas indica TaxID=428993 RepID=A0A1T5LJ90_9GAMM|nr:hypothetical protein [Pseudoxanthomonas indica]GGD35897.1 hypothetical protein GCM10007235_04850 [Pseudoxanthomonas indica]SKC76042.1 hypothetical protein SAMN06296058_2610 [Pseudoxanthomonas indica]
MNQNDESLRWKLRGLRQDQPPARDLWPDISARIAQLPPRQEEAPLQRLSGVRRFAPWAMAASLVLTVGLAWQATRVAPQDPVIPREAASLTRDYQGALAQMQGAEAHPEFGVALQELDRSAAQIRAAIDHDPNAMFLLEQLRRTYAKRLALTQRAVMS